MPQTIPREILDARFAHCRFKPVLITLQWLSLHINKHGADAVQRTLLQRLERGDRYGVQGDVAGFPVLAPRDSNRPTLQVNARPSEGVLLAGSPTGVDTHLGL